MSASRPFGLSEASLVTALNAGTVVLEVFDDLKQALFTDSAVAGKGTLWILSC
jgi:hypothetical protein